MIATDVLADPFASALAGVAQPTTLRTNIFPWEDLDAQNIPERFALMSHDVIPTVSVLAAQTQLGARLVKYDEAGRALSTGDRVSAPTINVPPGGVVTQNVILTVGTESIDVKTFYTDAIADTAFIKVTGHDSGFLYLPQIRISDTQRRYIVGVDTSQDGSVDILIGLGPQIHGLTALVTLVKAVDELTILSSPGQEPSVHVLDMPIFSAGALTSASFSLILGAGATADLTTAIAGISMAPVFWGVGVITAGAALVVLEDDLGKFLAQVNTSITGVYDKFLQGIRGGLGRKLRLHNISGVAAGTISGELTFGQLGP